eukprot:TRINITY_DN4721_c0_g1_i7.p1 TRINITY_DN4721_c0_g1~~TRINITY_DN4721_c0_g1_i7.p1  ORF type:complete len:314 (-),score=9.90 TRINITY_DN4721_c0_g1_i7:240-1082(-)
MTFMIYLSNSFFCNPFFLMCVAVAFVSLTVYLEKKPPKFHQLTVSQVVLIYDWLQVGVLVLSLVLLVFGSFREIQYSLSHGLLVLSCDPVGELVSDAAVAHPSSAALLWAYLGMGFSAALSLFDSLARVLLRRPISVAHFYHRVPYFLLSSSALCLLHTGMWWNAIFDLLIRIARYSFYIGCINGFAVRHWKPYIQVANILQLLIACCVSWIYPYLYFTQPMACSGSVYLWGAVYFYTLSLFALHLHELWPLLQPSSIPDIPLHRLRTPRTPQQKKRFFP